MVNDTFSKIRCLGKTILKWLLISLFPLSLTLTEFTCGKYLIKSCHFKCETQKILFNSKFGVLYNQMRKHVIELQNNYTIAH